MGRNAQDLLERMKRSTAGWKRSDIDAVYEGYGFIIKGRAKHDKVWHPDFPQLVTFLPRHRKIGESYVVELILKIAQLAELKAKREKNNE